MIIYGAGSAGIQLASALKQSSEAKVVAFVDDNSHLHGLMIAGLPVYSPKILTALIAKKSVRRILFALPSASMERQSELEVALMLRDLGTAIAGNDPTLIRKLVTKWVDGYHQPEREAEIA
ncbi:nucleoside-diphosphate sugar epimerase/dehydratase [Pseudogemmobacter sp. W21_MBD1_M6]|uniref:nucleoside-diphosphate sugar epimerase/dehydratase n=1 Tax=Pseudogemmobacter sp. W21_MBD1_M6 TaxID=3240271 RepID=UPI003F98F492